MNHKAFLVFLFVHVSKSFISQSLEKDKQYYLTAIGFWNVENLYDTLNDQWKNDDDFTPVGIYSWNGDRYRTKLFHLAEVISQMATDVTPAGLAIVGLCEIENKSVVQDLVNSNQLKTRNYQVVHIEGPDARGVDPALIYNPNYFKLKRAVSYGVKMVTDSMHKTRDILVVTGSFNGEVISILVNHWPSRRGGELASRPNRNKAAQIVRKIADSIQVENPNSKIVIMGDLNDDPINESVKKGIGTSGFFFSTEKGKYYNPMENLFKEGIGSLAWEDSWNLFDQIILSNNWTDGDFASWQYYAVRVFNKSFLKSDFGNFKGYPLRTFSGSNYTAGYSDHFPVYVVIAKEKK